MEKTVFILGIFLLVSITKTNAQEPIDGDYILHFTTSQTINPHARNASIYSKGDALFISIQYPVESKSAQIIHNDEMDYKFQISEIQNNELVSTQFVGSKNKDDNILGVFIVTVDGLLQENRSGSFKLIKHQDQTRAANKVGGHIGVVHGLFTLSQGNIRSILDTDYSIGFPMGITIRKNHNFAFDLELVPSISLVSETQQDKIDLLIHPGLLWGLGNSLTFGTRLAFELGLDGRYGFTPLLNFGNIFPNGFIEVVLPVRFNRNHSTSVTLGVHIGVGF